MVSTISCVGRILQAERQLFKLAKTITAKKKEDDEVYFDDAELALAA